MRWRIVAVELLGRKTCLLARMSLCVEKCGLRLLLREVISELNLEHQIYVREVTLPPCFDTAGKDGGQSNINTLFTILHNPTAQTLHHQLKATEHT